MCAGLPCIVSEHIGDTAEILREGQAGIVLGREKSCPGLLEFQGLLEINREEISRAMIQRYSSDVYLPQILQLYEELGSDKRKGIA
jgi:hypothetical protein